MIYKENAFHIETISLFILGDFIGKKTGFFFFELLHL